MRRRRVGPGEGGGCMQEGGHRQAVVKTGIMSREQGEKFTVKPEEELCERFAIGRA